MDKSSSSKSGSKIIPDEERPTNTGSGSNEEEEDNAGWVFTQLSIVCLTIINVKKV